MSSERLGTLFDQEAIFDAVLAQHNPDLLQQSFHEFLSQRQRLEQEKILARQDAVEREFFRLGLVPPTQPPEFGEYGFNVSLQRAHSEYLRGRHGSLGDLIKLHRGETADEP